jgi:hypothetical protein
MYHTLPGSEPAVCSQADVFSFAIVLYELLHQRLIMATLIAQQIQDRHLFENEIMEFTKVRGRREGEGLLQAGALHWRMLQGTTGD